MALTGTPRERGVYDDKRCFERYMKWGAAATHDKLRQWCISVGMVNSNTGKVSQMGAYWAMWRYAMNNAEEAYPLYKDWWFENDPQKRTPTFLKFLTDIQNHAYDNKSVASQYKYEDFCEKWELPILPQKIKMTMSKKTLFSTNGHIHEENRQNQEVSVEAGDAIG